MVIFKISNTLFNIIDKFKFMKKIIITCFDKIFLFDKATCFLMQGYKEDIINKRIIIKYTHKYTRFMASDSTLNIIKDETIIERFSKKDIIKIYKLHISTIKEEREN